MITWRCYCRTTVHRSQTQLWDMFSRDTWGLMLRPFIDILPARQGSTVKGNNCTRVMHILSIKYHKNTSNSWSWRFRISTGRDLRTWGVGVVQDTSCSQGQVPYIHGVEDILSYHSIISLSLDMAKQWMLYVLERFLVSRMMGWEVSMGIGGK